jgi:hypothetical protein
MENMKNKKEKRTLLHLGSLAAVIGQGVMTPAQVEGQEFLFYSDETFHGEDCPTELAAVVLQAKKDGRYARGPYPSRDSPDADATIWLEMFLDGFGFFDVISDVERTLFGAPTEFIQAFYEGPGEKLRVFGPCGFWSGFPERWTPGFGNQAKKK